MELKPPSSESPEQSQYAATLRTAARLCLVALLMTFAVYVAGLCAPHVPVDRLPDLWHLPAKEFIRVVQVKPGWGWMRHAGTGDYLNLIPIAMLALVSPICYLRILPTLIRRRDWGYVVIAVATILIIALAACGILHSGH